MARPWPRGGAKVNSGQTVGGARDLARGRTMIATWSPRRSCPTDPIRRSVAVDDLRLDVVRLASLTPRRDRGRAPRPSSTATSTHADRVVADDDAIDSLRHAIEDECLRILGRRASARPTSASSAWHAARRPRARAQRRPHGERRQDHLAAPPRRASTRPSRRIVDRHGPPGRRAAAGGGNAFADRDPSWAAALADMDDTIDELERRLFRHVLEVDGGAPIDDARAQRAVQLALVARHYERIGDHAVTIAEQVHFVVDRRARTPRRATAPAMTPASLHCAERPAGERGAGKGGVPGPALSVRRSSRPRTPNREEPIPELLSEGGSAAVLG